MINAGMCSDSKKNRKILTGLLHKTNEQTTQFWVSNTPELEKGRRSSGEL